MSALRGSLTYARFFVEGDLPDDFRERAMRSIRARVMRPLEADDEDLERSGWCLLGDAYGLELTYDTVFANEWLNLGFRTDRWVLPGPALRARVREAERAYLEKKGRERLTRREKTELKELVSRKMRREMSPAIKAVDLSWAMNEGIVRFFSHGPKPAGRMMELFAKTFGALGLKLVPEAPYTLAARLGMSRASEAAWEGLAPTLLADGSGLAQGRAARALAEDDAEEEEVA